MTTRRERESLTRIKREKSTVGKSLRRSIAAAVLFVSWTSSSARSLLGPAPLLSLSLSLSPSLSLPPSSAGIPPRRAAALAHEKPNISKTTKTPTPSPSGLPADLQRLSFAGRPVSEELLPLALLGVTDDSTLHCSLALLGGGKKRKKKTYTKPKKQKHKHRKVKLGVLKFFKVDDGGKVERLRQACPQCGPATFMAKHFDRVYCGKCHVTYMVEGGAAGGGKGKKK